MKKRFDDFANNSFSIPELKCISASHVFLGNSWRHEDVTSPFARIYIIVEGEGLLKYDKGAVKLEKGRAYLVPTGLNFSYSCEEYLEKYYFHINLLNNVGMDILRNISCIKCVEIKDVQLNALRDTEKKQSISDALKLRGIVTDILSEILKLCRGELSEGDIYSRTVINAIEYIANNLSLKLSLSEIAEKLFVGKSTLQKTFKSEMGISIGKYIDNMVLFRCQMLLAKTDMSVKEISEKLGFCDQFYLSRRFKEAFDVTPLSYRKKQTNII